MPAMGMPVSHREQRAEVTAIQTMSLRNEFINRLGEDKDMIKQVGNSDYIIELGLFSDGSGITVWQKNENDTRGWTPQYSRTFWNKDYDNQYESAKRTYKSITSVKKMKSELNDYYEDTSLDPEIPKDE